VELAFLFHNAPLAGFHYTEDEEELSEQMMTYWTNFAHYGDPNGASGSLDWPQYTSYTKSVLRFLTPKNMVYLYSIQCVHACTSIVMCVCVCVCVCALYSCACVCT